MWRAVVRWAGAVRAVVEARTGRVPDARASDWLFGFG